VAEKRAEVRREAEESRERRQARQQARKKPAKQQRFGDTYLGLALKGLGIFALGVVVIYVLNAVAGG
jgi:hypothetical protein